MDELRLISVVWAEFMSVDAISADAISRGKGPSMPGTAISAKIRLPFVKVLFLPVRILNRAGSFLLYRSRRAQNAILLSLFAPGSLPGPWPLVLHRHQVSLCSCFFEWRTLVVGGGEGGALAY